MIDRKLQIWASLAICLGIAHSTEASTVQILGAGSAVVSADRSATFDSLTSTNVVHLDTYTEGGLSITTSGNSWAEDLSSAATLNPFHGGGGADSAFYAIAFGNEDWVTIQTADATLQKMFGIEFTYGNTWTTGDVFGQYPWGNSNAVVEWQTWSNGSLVSSGSIGGSPLLEVGTVIGFSDPSGFDQFLVRAIIDTPGSPPLQAIALDNLNVQLTMVREPPSIFLAATVLACLPALLRCKNRSTA